MLLVTLTNYFHRCHINSNTSWTFNLEELLSQKHERCPGEGCCCVKCCWCSTPVMWCGDRGDMLGVLHLQCAWCSAKVVHVCPSLTASLVLGVATCPLWWVMLLPGIQLVSLMSQHCLGEYSRCGWILGTCCTCSCSLCKKADYIWDYVWNIVSVQVNIPFFLG